MYRVSSSMWLFLQLLFVVFFALPSVLSLLLFLYLWHHMWLFLTMYNYYYVQCQLICESNFGYHDWHVTVCTFSYHDWRVTACATDKCSQCMTKVLINWYLTTQTFVYYHNYGYHNWHVTANATDIIICSRGILPQINWHLETANNVALTASFCFRTSLLISWDLGYHYHTRWDR